MLFSTRCSFLRGSACSVNISLAKRQRRMQDAKARVLETISLLHAPGVPRGTIEGY